MRRLPRFFTILSMAVLWWGVAVARDVNYHIEAQALPGALMELARQSSLVFLYIDTPLRSFRSPEVVGVMSEEQALYLILQNSPFHGCIDDGVIRVEERTKPLPCAPLVS